MICVWCHSKFWSTFRFTTIHFIFTVGLLYRTVIPSYSVLEHNQYYATLVVWVVFRNYNSSSAPRDFLSLAHVRHIIEIIRRNKAGSHSVGKLLCHGSVSLVMMCRHLMNYRIELCTSYHLIPVHLLNGASMDCYFILHLFSVPASPISLHWCHCICILSCGCVGLSVRRWCCGFWVCVIKKIGYRILNCIINLWSFIFGFYLSLGFPRVLFKVIFVAVIVSPAHSYLESFVSVVIFIGFRFLVWYNRICETAFANSVIPHQKTKQWWHN